MRSELSSIWLSVAMEALAKLFPVEARDGGHCSASPIIDSYSSSFGFV